MGLYEKDNVQFQNFIFEDFSEIHYQGLRNIKWTGYTLIFSLPKKYFYVTGFKTWIGFDIKYNDT